DRARGGRGGEAGRVRRLPDPGRTDDADQATRHAPIARATARARSAYPVSSGWKRSLARWSPSNPGTATAPWAVATSAAVRRSPAELASRARRRVAGRTANPLNRGGEMTTIEASGDRSRSAARIA